MLEKLSHSPCLTHFSRTGSLLCLTTAWTSRVVSPATGVSFTSSSSSSGHSLPLWQLRGAPPGGGSPMTGKSPFSAPPLSSSPSAPCSSLSRTHSWTLLVQWFFRLLRLLDMAESSWTERGRRRCFQRKKANVQDVNHMSAAEVGTSFPLLALSPPPTLGSMSTRESAHACTRAKNPHARGLWRQQQQQLEDRPYEKKAPLAVAFKSHFHDRNRQLFRFVE